VDVRDFARAVALGLKHGATGALYHIGSGKSRSGHELVQALIDESGLHGVRYQAAEPDAPALVPAQRADCHYAEQGLGWLPEIGWERSIHDLWKSTGYGDDPTGDAG
jgi:nucleoside-diphosphate-sugar epimerase